MTWNRGDVVSMCSDERSMSKAFVDNGQVIEREVELFTWEKLDKVEEIRANFGL